MCLYHTGFTRKAAIVLIKAIFAFELVRITEIYIFRSIYKCLLLLFQLFVWFKIDHEKTVILSQVENNGP
jgi:hypothetical protein